MPVIRVGNHTLRVTEDDVLKRHAENPEGSPGINDLRLEDHKSLRNRNDRYAHLYEGKRAERIRLARLRQKASQKGQDFRITQDEWTQFLQDNHVENIKGVEIRVIDPEKPFTINNLEVKGL